MLLQLSNACAARSLRNSGAGLAQMDFERWPNEHSSFEHPALNGLSYLCGSPADNTPAALDQTYSAAEVAAGMVAWLTAVIELLGRIIGDEMAMHLVAQIEIANSPAGARIRSEKDSNG